MKPKVKNSSQDVKTEKVRNGKVKKKETKQQTILKEKSSNVGEVIKQLEPKKLSAKKVSSQKKISKEINKSTENLETTADNAKETNIVHSKSKKKDKKKDKAAVKGSSKLPSTKEPQVLSEEQKAYAEKCTVFVGNLPVNTKSKQLARFFESCGSIKSMRFRTPAGVPIFKHATRKMAGSLIAFVHFESPEMAEKALALNGSALKNNTLRITKSNIKESAEAKNTVVVGNLKYCTTEQSLRDIFETCGDIKYVRCLQHKIGTVDKGCKGIAYVCFQLPDAVSLALELEGTMLNDRPIHVERFNEKKMNISSKKKNLEAEKVKSKTHNPLPNNEAKTSTVEAKKPKKKFAGVKITSTKSKDKISSKKKKIQSKEITKLVKKIAPIKKSPK